MTDFKAEIAERRADVKADPDDANAHYNLGLMLLRSIEAPLRGGALSAGDKKAAAEAEKSFKKALDLADNHGRAHIMIGMLFRFTMRYQEAEPHLKRGLELPPESQDWMNACDTLAACYMEQERYDDAVTILEPAILHHASDPLGYWKLGSSLFSLKRYPESRKVLEAGLQACPGHAGLAASLSELLQVMEPPVEAEIPKEYADKQKQVEAWAKDLQEECTRLMQGKGAQDAKMKKMTALQTAFQDKVKKLYGG
jgi:tetratricopeptide (TPR) repeat protein